MDGIAGGEGSGAKLCVLLAVRSSQGVSDPTMRAWLELDCAHHIDLGPLSEEGSRELAHALAGGPSLPRPGLAV